MKHCCLCVCGKNPKNPSLGTPGLASIVVKRLKWRKALYLVPSVVDFHAPGWSMAVSGHLLERGLDRYHSIDTDARPNRQWNLLVRVSQELAQREKSSPVHQLY